MNNYIGISEDRLHHILGVARESYQIAKDKGYDEVFCKKMFMIGWNHDVGYEFAKEQTEHPQISSEMVHSLVCINKIYDTPISTKTNHAINYHGCYPDKSIKDNKEWIILNIADLTIDSKGNKVDIMQRLEDIKNRYGSNQYLTACDIAVQVGLIDRNSIERNIDGG